MRVINASLDDPAERITDQTIGALASLIMFEVSLNAFVLFKLVAPDSVAQEMYGSSAAATLHRKGLKQLLELRYASAGPEMHWLVQHFIVQ